jgi:alpha-glucosidase
MEDGVIPPDKVQDPWEKNVPGLGLGRDPERTPMQWDDSPNAGFCPVEADPWLPLAENYQSLNVAQQQADKRSILTMTQQLIALRQQSPALLVGRYSPVNSPQGTFVYRRQHENEGYLIALNFTAEAVVVALPEDVAQAELTFCTHLDREAESITEKLELRPNEGVLLAI